MKITETEDDMREIRFKNTTQISDYLRKDRTKKQKQKQQTGGNIKKNEFTYTVTLMTKTTK